MKRGLLVSVAAMLSAAAAPAQPEPAAVGGGFEVERYALSLTPNPAGKSVTGTEKILVRSLRDGLRSVVFSANALVIDGATANGRTLRVNSGEAALVIAFPSALPRGRTVEILVRYHGVPRRGITATAGSIYSSYFACDWMICLQDSPGDKAWFDLDLRISGDMTSLASGRMVGQARDRGGAVIHRWRTTRPYSAYLYSFAVGPFVRAGERGGGADLAYYGEVRPRPS
jgi:aminopeptidase N